MITSAGIGSGLDIDGIVSQLMVLERRPLDQAEAKKSEIQSEISAFGQVKAALGSFVNVLERLGDDDNYVSYSASSGDEEVFTVSTSSLVSAPVDASVEVVQLARASKHSSALFAEEDAVGTGTLTLTVGDDELELTVDGSNNTLAGIAEAINLSQDNPGVSATVLHSDAGSRLVLTANETGEDNAVGVSADAGLSALGLALDHTALDGQIRVDGNLVSSSTNTFSNVYDGVTIEAKSEATAALQVSLDSGVIESELDTFVKEYNTLRGVLRALDNSTLSNERMLDGIDAAIRNALFVDRTDTNGSFSHLVTVGIELTENGNLSLDSARLSEALGQDADAVRELFTFSSEDAEAVQGFATALLPSLQAYTEADGVIDSRTGTLESEIGFIDIRIEALASRLDRTEQRLLDEFIAMDTLVAQLQGTSNYLSQQLAALPVFNNTGNNN